MYLCCRFKKHAVFEIVLADKFWFWLDGIVECHSFKKRIDKSMLYFITVIDWFILKIYIGILYLWIKTKKILAIYNFIDRFYILDIMEKKEIQFRLKNVKSLADFAKLLNDVKIDEFKTSKYKISEGPVSYTHLTLPTMMATCRSRWSPYH